MVCQEGQANPEEEIWVSPLLDYFLREVIFPEPARKGEKVRVWGAAAHLVSPADAPPSRRDSHICACPSASPATPTLP